MTIASNPLKFPPNRLKEVAKDIYGLMSCNVSAPTWNKPKRKKIIIGFLSRAEADYYYLSGLEFFFAWIRNVLVGIWIRIKVRSDPL